MGINIEQGISYCGDKEGLREIIGIYHSEGSKRSSQLQHFFEERDWKTGQEYNGASFSPEHLVLWAWQ